MNVEVKNLAAAAQHRKGPIKSKGQEVKPLRAIKIDEEFLGAENETTESKKEQEIVD